MCCSGLHAAGRKWWQRVCEKQLTEPNPPSIVPVPVVLHIYNFHGVSSTFNQLIRHTVGGQVLHAGVEVYGQEWSYGETDAGHGLMRCKPKQAEHAGHNFCESVHMGETTLSKQEVKDLLRGFAREWRGRDYDLLRHNCCHFCDSFCQRLGVGPIPEYVNCLADKVASIDDVFKEADSTMEANFEKARAKTAEINTLICDTFKAKTDELIDNIKVVANPEANQTVFSEGRPSNIQEFFEVIRRSQVVANPEANQTNFSEGRSSSASSSTEGRPSNIQEFFEVKSREFRNSFEAASRDFHSHADELQRKINNDFRNSLEATSREFRAHADEFDRKIRTEFISKIETTSRDIREKTDELDRKLRQEFLHNFDDFQAQADELDRQLRMCQNPNEAVSTEELLLDF